MRAVLENSSHIWEFISTDLDDFISLLIFLVANAQVIVVTIAYRFFHLLNQHTLHFYMFRLAVSDKLKSVYLFLGLLDFILKFCFSLG